MEAARNHDPAERLLGMMGLDSIYLLLNIGKSDTQFLTGDWLLDRFLFKGEGSSQTRNSTQFAPQA
ncbi:MAG: hypothetical protein ACE5I0_07985, partial [Candidatus Binatia bacterium]